jgi:hypothetical protein
MDLGSILNFMSLELTTHVNSGHGYLNHRSNCAIIFSIPWSIGAPYPLGSSYVTYFTFGHCLLTWVMLFPYFGHFDCQNSCLVIDQVAHHNNMLCLEWTCHNDYIIITHLELEIVFFFFTNNLLLSDSFQKSNNSHPIFVF